MAKFNYIRRSFRGGQVSDEAAGRLDLPRVQEGAKQLTNFLPNYYGSISRRPGTEYITSAASTDAASRLIPFEASDDEAYLLEFTPNGAIKIYKHGVEVAWQAKVSNLIPNNTLDGSNAGWVGVATGTNSPSITNTGTALSISGAGTQPDFQNSSFTDNIFYWNGNTGATWGTGGTVVLSSITNPDGPIIWQTVPTLVSGSYTISTDITNVGSNAEVYISVGTSGAGSSDLYATTMFNTTGVKTHSFTVPAGTTAITYTCQGGDSNTVTITSVSITTKPTPSTSAYAYTILPYLSAGSYTMTTTKTSTLKLGTSIGGSDIATIGASTSFTVTPAQEGPLYLTAYAGTVTNLELTAQPTESSLEHPYTVSQLQDIKFAQDKNSLYLVHPEVKPRRLVRFSDTVWSMQTIDSAYTLEAGDPTSLLSGGPYLPSNDTAVEIGLSAASGSSITALASGPLFQTGDVGRFLRWRSTVGTDPQVVSYIGNGTQTSFSYDYQLQSSTDIAVYVQTSGYRLLTLNTDYYVSPATDSTPTTVTLITAPESGSTVTIQLATVGTGVYGYGKITAVTSPTSATIRSYAPFGTVSRPSTDWSLGGFSDALGYPSAVAIHEGRLWFGGVPEFPTLLFSSAAGSSIDFRPDNGAGTILATSPMTLSAASKKLSKIQWLIPRNNLIVGTSSSLYELVPSQDGMSALNLPSVSHRSEDGVRNVDALAIKDTLIYASRSGAHMMAATYQDQQKSLGERILSMMCPELFTSPIKRYVYQAAPDSVIWILKEDGTVATCTYRPDEDVIAFAEQQFDGIVEDLCVVREIDEDVLYLAICREINGSSVRYLEKLKPSRPASNPELAWHLDCGLETDGAQSATIQLSARSGSVTVDTIVDTFTAGDIGRYIRLVNEDVLLKITGFTSPTSVTGTLLASVTKTTYIGGEWALSFTEIAGLSHLEGRTVSIWADGGPHTDVVVASGRVTLSRPCFHAVAGLGFVSTAITTDLAIDTQNMGTILGNVRKVRAASILLKDSGPCLVSTETGFAEERLRADLATPYYSKGSKLLTGRFPVAISSDYEYNCRLVLESETAAPLTIQDIVIHVEIGGSK